MATFESLAYEYAEYIRNNARQPYVVPEIMRRLNSLTYTDSGNPLTREDKLKILSHIEVILSMGYGKVFEQRAEDSSDFLDILNQLKNAVRR